MDGLVQLQMVVYMMKPVTVMVFWKCPYSKCEVSPEQACNDSTFFCELVGKVKFDLRKVIHIIIKSSCNCTLGMIVSSGVIFAFLLARDSVQRIFPDTKWQEDAIPLLESFFDDFVLPEIVLNKYKPRYRISSNSIRGYY